MPEKKIISFEEAFSWLNRLPEEKIGQERRSYLSAPVANLVQHMNNAYKAGDYPKVIYYIDVIKDVGKRVNATIDVREREVEASGVRLAETYLQCGRAYYCLHDYRGAITDFREAISYYQSGQIPVKHNRAIVGWLLGWAFWHIAKQGDAIVEWEMSCKKFEEILKNPDFTNFSTDRVWYEKQHQRMCESIRLSIEMVDEGRWPFDEKTIK